jgi:hypothetical protein
MSVDLLERERQLTRCPPARPPYTPTWRPRLVPLAISLAVSLAMWAGIIALIRWALLTF